MSAVPNTMTQGVAEAMSENAAVATVTSMGINGQYCLGCTGVYPEDPGINPCVGARHEPYSWRYHFAFYFLILNRKSRKISINVSYL